MRGGDTHVDDVDECEGSHSRERLSGGGEYGSRGAECVGGASECVSVVMW